MKSLKTLCLNNLCRQVKWVGGPKGNCNERKRASAPGQNAQAFLASPPPQPRLTARRTKIACANRLAKLKPPFVTLHDSKQKLVKQVQVPTMPTSYLVDRSGKVRFVHPGFHGEQTERELQKEIEALLDEKAPSP